MKNLSTILYGLILCILLVLILKISTPDAPKDMVLIPAGDDIDGFYMDVYEVTNADYKEFIDVNPQWHLIPRPRTHRPKVLPSIEI